MVNSGAVYVCATNIGWVVVLATTAKQMLRITHCLHVSLYPYYIQFNM